MLSGRFGAGRGDVLRLFEGDSVAGLGDGELLERFASRRDEAAFEALVTRLGPMVLGVCRRMLSDPHDVDDAFQATFLVLVRRAGSIRNPDLVAPWLHGVATRVARRARAESARRAARERVAVVPEAREEAAGLQSEWPELRALIDEEIERLPEHHRRAVVLCDVEGLSREEAALRLGWSLNMVRGRLERARDRLRGRLARRGLAPSGAWAALVVAPPVPSPALLAATTRAAWAFSVGRVGTGMASASAVALSRGVLNMMMLSKLKVGLAVLLSAGFVTAGSGMLAAQGPGDKPAGKAVQGGAALPGVTKDALTEAVGDMELVNLGLSRINMARKRWETQLAFYKEGRITIDRLLNASQTLMDAELDATEAPEARLNAIKAHLDRIKDVEKREKAELEVGRATTADLEEVQSHRLDVEFKLAKEARTVARKARVTSTPVPAKAAEPMTHASLGKERVEMARKRWETQRTFYKLGRITIDRLLNASQTLMDAELDATDGPDARLTSLKAHLDRIKEIEKNELAELKAGRATNADVEEVQTYRLEVEFRIAKEAEAAKRKAPAVSPPAAARAGAQPPLLTQPHSTAELAKARIELASERFKGRMALYDAGQITNDRLVEASRALMEAERDAAASKYTRVEAVRAHLGHLEAILKREQADLKGGATTADIADVKSALLDAEFALAKELETPETKPTGLDANGESHEGVAPAPNGPLPSSRPGASNSPKEANRSPLGEAVEAFNARWGSDPAGQGQPPLTEDEVIAAIRYSESDPNALDVTLLARRKIAETRQMPPGSTFEVLMSMDPGGDFVYQGWWVRIVMPKGDGGTYAFPIRSRLLRSVTLEEVLAATEADLKEPTLLPGRSRMQDDYVKNLKARIEKRDKTSPIGARY